MGNKLTFYAYESQLKLDSDSIFEFDSWFGKPFLKRKLYPPAHKLELTARLSPKYYDSPEKRNVKITIEECEGPDSVELWVGENI